MVLVVIVDSFLFFILLLYLHFNFDFHLVVVFHLSMFFIYICFSTSSFTPPWTITGFLHPFYTFSPAHRRVICKTFIFNNSVIFLPRALRFWVGVFYPQVFFTLRSFTDILTCVYQGLPGSRQFFLKVCRASYWSSKHRPDPSVCLIHSNPQSSSSERFIFKFYQALSWVIRGESLVHLLLTRFELFSLVQSHM